MSIVKLQLQFPTKPNVFCGKGAWHRKLINNFDHYVPIWTNFCQKWFTFSTLSLWSVKIFCFSLRIPSKGLGDNRRHYSIFFRQRKKVIDLTSTKYCIWRKWDHLIEPQFILIMFRAFLNNWTFVAGFNGDAFFCYCFYSLPLFILLTDPICLWLRR